ncbi:10601_t:CDS:2 [Entrophospora sp. SA101]|nr:10601_t:CDS:2 [Entrophospora sp. SA101]
MSIYDNDSQPPRKGPGRPRKISQPPPSSKSINIEDSSQPRKRLRISFKNDKTNEPLEEFRRKLIYERVDELSKLVDKHDLLLRELYFHETNKPLEDFDPEKVKHDNSIPIEKYITDPELWINANDLISDIIHENFPELSTEKKFSQHHSHHQSISHKSNSSKRNATLSSNHNHRVSRSSSSRNYDSNSALYSPPPSSSNLSSYSLRRNNFQVTRIPQFPHFDEFLNSFVTLDDDKDVTIAEADSRAQKDADTLWLIFQLEREGRSLKIPPPHPEIPHVTSNWDMILNSIEKRSKMIKKYSNERNRITRTISKAIIDYFNYLANKDLKENLKEEKRLKKLAKTVANMVKKKWMQCEKVVKKKQEELLQEKQDRESRHRLNRLIEHSAQILEAQQKELLGETVKPEIHILKDTIDNDNLEHQDPLLENDHYMEIEKIESNHCIETYLAVEKGDWGPHLIIVPTSVLINWEREFFKWCPGFKIISYYGSPIQRKIKTIGWTKDNAFHVCITSYHIALLDQAKFKKMGWHYLILDEAHNIKNFESKRWNTLVTFRAERRLLLTGTPLQNNLTELWSLMRFLMPDGVTIGDSSLGFANQKEFINMFSQINKSIEDNVQADEETIELVRKLHTLLRPHMLRRMKIDVERQLPAKHHHIIKCRLSKRQRFLYDDFMSRAKTKEILQSGNFLSIINCLMQLRKVCNHPDLFEVRPIRTSFAMTKSAISDYEIKELLVRKRLLQEIDSISNVDLYFLNLVPTKFELRLNQLISSEWDASNTENKFWEKIDFYSVIKKNFDPNQTVNHYSIVEFSNIMHHRKKIATRNRWNYMRYVNSLRIRRQPIYGTGLIDICRKLGTTVCNRVLTHAKNPREFWNFTDALYDMITSYERRYQIMEEKIDKFAFVTPAVVAKDIVSFSLGEVSENLKAIIKTQFKDIYHPIRVKLQIAFPDKRLLQYDCGKLQELDILLRRLKEKGHRALIFTQMTRVLDILEIFLNIHGHTYLRLDVNIYRFVSEHTIEENILLKANQKRMLDKLVIMDGEFTTDFFQRVDWRALVSDIAPNCSNEIKDEPKDGVELEHYLDKVEDDTDVDAAKISRNEFEIDIPDFSEDYVATELSSPIKIDGTNDDNPDHIDNYMLHFVERELT